MMLTCKVCPTPSPHIPKALDKIPPAPPLKKGGKQGNLRLAVGFEPLKKTENAEDAYG